MGIKMRHKAKWARAAGLLALTLIPPMAALPALAQSSAAPAPSAISPVPAAYKAALMAEAELSGSGDLLRFYAAHDFAPLWIDEAAAPRRAAFLSAIASAAAQGLPAARYDAGALIAAAEEARTEGDLGRLELRFSQALMHYAGDLQSGVLIPGVVDDGIKREVTRRDPLQNLADFRLAADPGAWLAAQQPDDPAYAQLIAGKLALEGKIAAGGWGAPVPAKALAQGDSGAAVIALRDRLIAMDYLAASATQDYDSEIAAAVQDFQLDHGLLPDGAADEVTLGEINTPPEARLGAIVVALERLRWMDGPRGARHIWVNIPDYTAKIVEDGRTVFQTRSVVGKASHDQRTPEFSDQMEHMVINPSWNVPRSITVKEYLPQMQQNPGAAGHLQLIDARGRVVPREAIDFAAYTPSTFPFAMRQAPSDDNALGLVKFMFPNPHNIYLHDTPSKSLFAKETRAFSHGCIRLGDPFGFAYAMLSVQSHDPKGLFHAELRAGGESTVPLQAPVPVHLVYFTAFPGKSGAITYRRDVYGRDGKILEALEAAGLDLSAPQG